MDILHDLTSQVNSEMLGLLFVAKGRQEQQGGKVPSQRENIPNRAKAQSRKIWGRKAN